MSICPANDPLPAVTALIADAKRASKNSKTNPAAMPAFVPSDFEVAYRG
jgi:hypothetical protein